VFVDAKMLFLISKSALDSTTLPFLVKKTIEEREWWWYMVNTVTPFFLIYRWSFKSRFFVFFVFVGKKIIDSASKTPVGSTFW
jgi:hypothetical protein